MPLERVTSRSSEASLAGWIASNDATLFTMVLAVVIAIFLHSRLSSGARDNLQLQESQAALAADLEAAQDKLNLTQQDRDQIQRQLNEKLDRIVQLMAQLDAAAATKDQLADEHHTLAATAKSLVEEKAKLAATNSALQTRIDEISRQLEERLAAMQAVEKHRDRLKMQADELEVIVAGLMSDLEAANADLVDARQLVAAERAAAARTVDELASQLAAGEKQVEDYLAQLKRSAAVLQSVSDEKKQLQDALTAAQQQRQTDLLVESRNNRELVGLAGRLERVAILFDASGSMRQAAAVGSRDRWTEAQQIAVRWLNHLNVSRCVLIVFAADVRTFPDDGTLANLSGENGGEARAALLAQLHAVKPGGLTNTLAALQKAYDYDVDTILLFSDGAPSMADTGFYDPAIAQRIYDLCDRHANIPVNTIGLGNYFDKDMSTFLRTVASKTGGTFRGQ